MWAPRPSRLGTVRIERAGGLSSAPVFTTIQAAVDAAQEGDTLLLSDGLFVGPGNRDIVIADKDLVIRSVNGRESTVLDCQNLGRGFLFEGPLVTQRARLEGIWIRNGSTPLTQGAGVRVRSEAQPTILACAFESCFRQGLRYSGSSTGPPGLVADCLFLNNSNDGDGGGFWGGNVRVERCVFLGNTAGTGGGAVRMTESVRDSLFVGNQATNLVAGGGAIFFFQGTIENCTFVGNHSNQTGGALATFTTGRVLNSIFWGNTAVFGGQQVFQGGFGTTMVEYRNCDIEGLLDGFSISSNIFNEPSLVDCFDADPLFVDEVGGDYRLLSGSPCVDAGDTTTVVAGSRGDMEREPRLAGLQVDVGSDELWSSLVLTLVDPGFAGQRNSVALRNAEPDGLAALFWGTVRGPYPIPLAACPELLLGIADPAVLTLFAVSDAGQGSFERWVPPFLSGSSVLLQALVFSSSTGCAESNVIEHTYP